MSHYHDDITIILVDTSRAVFTANIFFAAVTYYHLGLLRHLVFMLASYRDCFLYRHAWHVTMRARVTKDYDVDTLSTPIIIDAAYVIWWIIFLSLLMLINASFSLFSVLFNTFISPLYRYPYVALRRRERCLRHIAAVAAGRRLRLAAYAACRCAFAGVL